MNANDFFTQVPTWIQGGVAALLNGWNGILQLWGSIGLLPGYLQLGGFRGILELMISQIWILDIFR